MKKIALIDGNSLMYRAYFATAYSNNLMKNSKGVYTNLVFSFIKMFEKILSSNYDGILVAFDKGKKTFRHEDFQEYKGKRTPMPEEMRMQIPYLEKYLSILNIKTFKKDLYEADDIIGTVSKIANREKIAVDIYSSDKDLFQLINEQTQVCMTRKGISDIEIYDVAHFREIYHLEPIQMIDLKALMGDPSDNIKGIKGIGEKTALKLLYDYSNIENLIEKREELKGSIKDKVCENYPDAILSKKLCTIYRDVELDFNLEQIEVREPNGEALVEFYKEMEFHSLLKTLKMPDKPLRDFKFTVIKNTTELSKILVTNSSLYLEIDRENYFEGNFIGLGISNKLGNFFVEESLIYSFDFQLFISDPKILKYTFDYKKHYVFFKRKQLDFLGVDFDLLLATYLLNPNNTKEEFNIICSYYDYDEVGYDDKNTKVKDNLFDMNNTFQQICKKSQAIFQLRNRVIDDLKKNNQWDLFQNVELPLSKTLGNMEFEGIKVDIHELERQNLEMSEKIDILERDIKGYSTETLNINSVKQLGTFLFEELKLTVVKKNKTGYSTDNETLEKIKAEHPVIEKIIEYRALSKLKSTYLEGIKEVLRDEDLVHTIYKQTLTQTGRLSSIEPNLQNIPVKTELGKQIRKMFVPKKEKHVFLSCDYSQIELRVLAHMANVKGLIESFSKNEDIHRRTAMEVFNTKEPSELERKRAKAVNFGIIYGISGFGLANDLNISRKEAEEYIQKYFEIYPEIQEFMKKTIEFCEGNSYVETLYHRRRYINDINSSIYVAREYAKRTAMNAPIQGTAADIIKIAMVKIEERINASKLKSKMILQVHDELIFEVIENELEIFKKLVREEMEQAVQLNVPLKVSLDVGLNWYEI